MNAIAPITEPTTLSLALVRGDTNTATENTALPWESWTQRLTLFAVRPEKNGAGFIPAVMNGTRKADNVAHYTALVLDVEPRGEDVPPDPAEAGSRLAEAGITGVIYTSHNHLAPAEINGGKPQGPRYRIVVPLADPMPPAALGANVELLAARLGLAPVVDPASKTRGQFFYLPSHRPDAPHFAQIIEGEFWRPIEAEPIAEPAPRTPAQHHAATGPECRVDCETWERAKTALGQLGGEFYSDYQHWLKIGMTLHSTGHPDAYEVWCDWSAQASSFDPTEAAKKWASFGEKFNGLTIGTLFHLGREQWPEPRPIAAKMHPVLPLRREMLPSYLANYIWDFAGRVPMAPDMVATAVLIALGSVIGARVAIKPKRFDDFSIVPNVWGGFVAPPSSNKSAAFSSGVKPLDKLAIKAQIEFSEAMEAYQMAQAKSAAMEAGRKSRISQAAKKGDEATVSALLEESSGKSEPPPALKRFKSNDSTPEALAELERTNPNGILVCRDELTGLLSNLDKEGNGEAKAFFLEGWNGTQCYEIDRIMRGHAFIENHCLSILGGIQPDKLIAYLEPSIKGLGNDGLFQRFQVMVYPDPIKWAYEDRAPDKEARDIVYDLFDRLDKLEYRELMHLGAHPTDEFNKRPYFRFCPNAQEAYIKWLTRLHTEKIADEPHPIVCEHLAKYQKLMPALALIFHLCDSLDIGKSQGISLDATEMAIEWCEYLETHARRIYGLVLDSAQLAAQALGAKLQELAAHEWMKTGFTASAVTRKNWKGLTSVETVHTALEILESEGWIRTEFKGPTDKGGRPSHTAFINPKIFKMARHEGDKTD